MIFSSTDIHLFHFTQIFMEQNCTCIDLLIVLVDFKSYQDEEKHENR